MKCQKCGLPLEKGKTFCNNCGEVVTTPPKKINKKLIIIIAALLIICTVVIISFKFKKQDNEVENTVVYKLDFEDFTFSIPESINFEVADTKLKLSDRDSTWIAEINVIDGSYDDLKNIKQRLQTYFEENGFTAGIAEIKTINDYEFITVELSSNNTNIVGAYSKLNSMKMAIILVYNQDNDYNYKAFKALAPIIKSATMKDLSNDIGNIPIPNIDPSTLKRFLETE